LCSAGGWLAKDYQGAGVEAQENMRVARMGDILSQKKLAKTAGTV
jgi:hypothetical protein